MIRVERLRKSFGLVSLTYGSATLTEERRSWLLRRIATTPLSPMQIITGKIAGRFAIAAVQVTLMVLVGVAANRLLGIYIGDSAFNLWVVLIVYAITVAPLGIMFGAWFREPEHAANVGILVTMVMAAFGGCWWPLEVVSKPMQAGALALPTGWAMKALHGVISFGFSLGEVLTAILVLLGFAAVFTAVAVRALRVE
jgi:ABC-type multidrug transport system permease subunit